MAGPQFLHNLIVYSLTSLACSFFFPYPSLWFSIHHFLFNSLPDFWSFFFNPRCFFLVGNTIILFLIGEWKLLSSSLRSPAVDIYHEYAERIRLPASGRVPSADHQEGKEMELVEGSLNQVAEEREEEKEKEKDDVDEDQEEEEEEEEDQSGLPAEELNRRVEDFIARINKQRWLESKSLVYDDRDLPF